MYCRAYWQKFYRIFSYYPLNAYRSYSSVSSSIPDNTGNLHHLVFLFSLISLILLISEEQSLVSLIFLSLVFYCIDFCHYLYCLFFSSTYFGLNLPINSTTWIIVKFLESTQTIKTHSRNR